MNTDLESVGPGNIVTPALFMIVAAAFLSAAAYLKRQPKESGEEVLPPSREYPVRERGEIPVV